MSITITAYTSNKRRNSTAIPTGGTKFQAAFKENTSLINPTLILHASLFPYTEISFTAEGVTRYYFIEDVTYMADGLYECSCAIDVLATWKDYIVGYQAYVAYSTSGYSSALPDMRIPVNYTQTTTHSTFKVFDGIYRAAGSYMLSCVGEGSSGVNTYMLNPGQFISLMSRIAEYQDIYNANWPSPPALNLEEILNWLGELFQTAGEVAVTSMKQMNSFGNALQAIRGCTWIPFRPETSGASEIVLGGYHTGLSAPTVTGAAQVAMASGTLQWVFGDWRDGERHSDAYMYLPWVGTVSLPTSQIQGDTAVDISCSLSPLTGDIAYIVIVGNKQVAAYGASTGCAVPVGVSNVQPLGSVNSIVASAAAIPANPIAGSFGLVSAATAAVTPVSSSVGGCGNSAAGGQNNLGHLYVCGHSTPEAPGASSNVRGRPTFKTMGVPSSGYVQTENFSLSAPCSDQEKKICNAMMDGGVYVE